MDFRHEIENFKDRIAAWLQVEEDEVPANAKTILANYRHTFGPNFILWIELARHQCKSDTAYTVCHENLICEVLEDHPRLLAEFIDEPYCESIVDDYALYIDVITEACSVPMEGLLILAVLEHASLVFIPWLERVARALGIDEKKCEYLRRHGEADIEHANAFLRALEAEKSHHQQRKLVGIVYVERLLQKIWMR